jgi:hypothetical protein
MFRTGGASPDFLRRHDFQLIDEIGKKHHGAVLLTMIPIAPIFAVGAHEDQRAVKRGDPNARHGNEDLAFKILRSSHRLNLSGIGPFRKAQAIVTGN